MKYENVWHVKNQKFFYEGGKKFTLSRAMCQYHKTFLNAFEAFIHLARKNFVKSFRS